MPSAVFLNPIGSGAVSNPRKKKRKIKSPRLKRWLAVVKRHGGNMVAAAKEWKGKGKGGSSPRRAAKPRRAKGLMPAAHRRAVISGLGRRAKLELGVANPFSPTAWAKAFKKATGKKARVKKAAPGTRAWWAKVAAGARRPASARKWASSLTALARREKGAAVKNPKRKKRKAVSRLPGSPAWRKKWATGLLRRARAEGVASNTTPAQWRKRWRAATGLKMGRNPVATTLKVLTSSRALEDYAYVTGGFVAGAVLPVLVARGLRRLGIAVPGGVAVEALLGVGTSIAAGAATGTVTKDASKGIKVTAGGLAGVVGALIVKQLEAVLPVSGLGGDAEDAVRRAVERELKKAGLGQFTLPEQVAEAPEVTGFGQFVTEEDVEEAAEVSGLDQDIEEGAQAFDGFDGDVF